MKALVLGGYGAVGAHVVAELRAGGDTAFSAGRDATKADRVIDLHSLHGAERASLRAALSDVDVVINASGCEDPQIASLATADGKAFVDLTATTSYVEEAERLEPSGPVLVNVGLAPGLTNLLAAEVHAAAPGPIDIVVLLGAGERHGPAATAWSYELLGREFRDPDTARRVRNYSEPRVFDLPEHGTRRVYRADFSDQHALTRDLNVPVRTYFGLDSRLATFALSVLTWLPAARSAPRGIPLPGSDRWLALARAEDGTTRHASGRGQSRATAVIAVVAARRAVRLPPGVHHLHQVLTLADVPEGRGILRTGNEGVEQE
jgi:saccharopine dehydrogenase-like NADP-dependent oxidoreductase